MKPRVVLGINDGHNATAALLVDGETAAIVSEERLVYRKNEMGLPVEAIKACLKMAGIDASQVDEVAFAGHELDSTSARLKREQCFTNRDWLDEQEQFWWPKFYEGRDDYSFWERLVADPRRSPAQAYTFEGIAPYPTREEMVRATPLIRSRALEAHFGIPTKTYRSYDHHSCHAAYGYYASPYRGGPALVFTSDAYGDGANATVSTVRDDSLIEVGRNGCTDLSRLYRYITLLLGMKPYEHEYKLMGLAPYASDHEIRKTDKVFRNLFHVPDFMIEYRSRPKDLFFHFRDQLADCRFDGIAGGLQRMVEEIGSEWIAKAVQRFGISRVVFSGGLSMNVRLNQRIAELDAVTEFYCAGSGGDESVAWGAACLAQRAHGITQIGNLRNLYRGMQHSPEEISAAIQGMEGVSLVTEGAAEAAAQLLANNKVVARFAGPMEFGARALGNRSILANPANGEMLNRINQQIKQRDFWMPFTPSVLDRYADKYLINPKRLLADHMTITFPVTAAGRDSLKAAIHPADGTARAQIVTANANGPYHQLLTRFSELTGVGALLNTSFNLHGLPMVGSPNQARHVFENSRLDAMLLESVLVARN